MEKKRSEEEKRRREEEKRSFFRLGNLTKPAFSAASIIETPMRSLTECAGLKNSSFATICAAAPSVMRRSRTSGVLPISAVTSSAMRGSLVVPEGAALISAEWKTVKVGVLSFDWFFLLRLAHADAD
jgi:hypothetical protein